MTKARHFRPAKVAHVAKALMKSSIIQKKPSVAPAWLKAVEMVPPAEVLTRPYAIQHTAPDPRARRPRNLYRPTRLVFPEDELRRTFYRDHPWELARPRLILEMDGLDGRRRDWSQGVRQPGMELSGECVVQRQLWLMENSPDMTKERAYDIARREFYAQRQQEDIERRIAVEEARVVGAYFGKTMLQVGMELEDKEYERWKAWAAEEITKQETLRNQADVSVVDVPENLEEELLVPVPP